MTEPRADEQGAIYPRLEDTNKVVTKDRRLLIWIVVAPYVLLVIGTAVAALTPTIAVSRVTLAASIIGGLGALAGAIITYYFKPPD
jgi:hypothetical protein